MDDQQVLDGVIGGAGGKEEEGYLGDEYWAGPRVYV